MGLSTFFFNKPELPMKLLGVGTAAIVTGGSLIGASFAVGAGPLTTWGLGLMALGAAIATLGLLCCGVSIFGQFLICQLQKKQEQGAYQIPYSVL